MSEEKEKKDQTEPVEAEIIENEPVETIPVEAKSEEESPDGKPLDEIEGMAEELGEEISQLKKELDEVRLKADEYLDGWQRAHAEFANYRKRVQREREQVQQAATGNVIRRYLEIVDDLERALKNQPKEGDGAVWAGGIDLIYRKLLNLLESEGLKPMEAEGQFFDPNLHEAISHDENPNQESGQIIEVVQQGYLIGDRVLRPARVRVAK